MALGQPEACKRAHGAGILVADDFAGWRSMVRELLDHSSKWRVIGEACDGLEAVEKAAQLQPDIVILDLGLPRMNGLQAARLIRQGSRSTAIVFLSENADADIQQAALKVGHAYVLKHDANTKLLPAIETAQATAASDCESDPLSSRS